MSKQEHPQPFVQSSFLPQACSTCSKRQPSLRMHSQSSEHQLLFPGGSGSPAGQPWPHSPAVPSPRPLLIPPLPAGTHSGHTASSEPGVGKQFLCLHPRNQANLKHAHLWNYRGAQSRAVSVIEERPSNPGKKIILSSNPQYREEKKN